MQFLRLPIRRNDNKNKNPAPGLPIVFFFFVVVVGDLFFPFCYMDVRTSRGFCVRTLEIKPIEIVLGFFVAYVWLFVGSEHTSRANIRCTLGVSED